MCQHHIRRGSDISIFSSPVMPIGVLGFAGSCVPLVFPGFGALVLGLAFCAWGAPSGRPSPGLPLGAALSGAGLALACLFPPAGCFGVDTGSIGILLRSDSA